MKQVQFYLLIILILSVACENSKRQQNKLEKSEEANLTSTEYKTQSGKVFIVHIDHSMGESICDVKIETKGFSAHNTTHNLGGVDKIEKVYLADLDGNGFEEIYVITRSAGSGSYSNIYGIASNNDKSATAIYVQPISEKQTEKGELFEGFMGHNQFRLKDNKLVNSFPIYLEGDTNLNPTGGQREIQYQLLPGEAGWILQAAKTIEP